MFSVQLHSCCQICLGFEFTTKLNTEHFHKQNTQFVMFLIAWSNKGIEIKLKTALSVNQSH